MLPLKERGSILRCIQLLKEDKMAEEGKSEAKANIKPAHPTAQKAAANVADKEHYEEVAEYRIGEGPPPLFLVLCFIFVVIWAMFSWIPFFGY